MEKNQIIWNWLLNYKELMRKWFEENLKLYRKLEENEEKAFVEYKKEHYATRIELLRRWHKDFADWHFEKEFCADYYANIHDITKQVARHILNLDKYLDKNIESHYNKLIKKVSAITGEITDAQLLVKNGELNGLIIGKNGKATINTITAGGYNIQCFHFRTLVKARA